ncbi:MAG TPA: D-alanine glycine permease, partial [Bacteroidetes bacterium]|nr:D-alanine glycine permease [Bacteroidota bacterium]
MALLCLGLVSKAEELGLDQQIDKVFGDLTGWFVDLIFYQIPFSENVSIYWVLFPLILGAGYFTFYFNLINFRKIGVAVNIVRG